MDNQNKCSNCSDLAKIKFILLQQNKIKLLCTEHRSELDKIKHLESMVREGNQIHIILPVFQKKISDLHQEYNDSITEFSKNFHLILQQLRDRLTEFDKLRKDIFNLNNLYKKEETDAKQMEDQILEILSQFQRVFNLDQEKAFRLMSDIDKFDDSINFKFRNMLRSII